MIRRYEKLDINVPESINEAAPAERLIFFDIETTGLKAGRSSLYLVGTVTKEDDGWYLTQLFSENLLDERNVLLGFKEIIDNKRKYGHPVLITYNGDGFDIPFVRETFREYSMLNPFSNTLSFDLLKVIKPYKKAAGLCDCKLKSVEKLVGYDREDKYSGGELIYVYEEYLRLSQILPGGCEDTEANDGLKKSLLRCMLLHNEEDVCTLPLLMDICSYKILMEGGFSLKSASMENGILDLRFELKYPLPRELYYEDKDYVISVSGEDRKLFELTAVLFEGELRYFYQDYKNYYYLPAEDMAVHKSVGEFVDRKNRVKATASTCYIKKKGLFVPQPEPVFAPCFYKTYKGEKYGEISAGILTAEDKLKEYALSVLAKICLISI